MAILQDFQLCMITDNICSEEKVPPLELGSAGILYLRPSILARIATSFFTNSPLNCKAKYSIHFILNIHFILLHKATDEFADLFLCNACQSTSNGFAHSCASCEFYLHVYCSFLTDTLIREMHQHPSMSGRIRSSSTAMHTINPPRSFFLNVLPVSSK